MGKEKAESLVRDAVWSFCLLPAPSFLYGSELLFRDDVVVCLLASLCQQLLHVVYLLGHLLAGLLPEDALKVGCHALLPVWVGDQPVPPLYVLWLCALLVSLPVSFGRSYCLCMIPSLLFSFVGCLYELPTLSALICWDLACHQLVPVFFEKLAFLKPRFGVGLRDAAR